MQRNPLNEGMKSEKEICIIIFLEEVYMLLQLLILYFLSVSYKIIGFGFENIGGLLTTLII